MELKTIFKADTIKVPIPYLRIKPRKKMPTRAKMMDLLSYREVSADILVDKSVNIPVDNQPSIGRVSAKYWPGMLVYYWLIWWLSVGWYMANSQPLIVSDYFANGSPIYHRQSTTLQNKWMTGEAWVSVFMTVWPILWAMHALFVWQC